MEEAVATGCLEKVPLVVPLQHVPSEANSKTFLNFDERQKVATALDKLCQVRSPNLEEVFKVSTAVIKLYVIHNTVIEETIIYYVKCFLFSLFFQDKRTMSKFDNYTFFRITIKRTPARFLKDN